MKGVSSAIVKSSVLHIGLVGTLLVSMEFHTPTPEPTPQVIQPIEAVVVDADALAKQMKKISDEKARLENAEKQRIKRLEDRAKEAENKRKKEEQRVIDIERQKKKRLKEKKQAEQAAAAARKKQQREKAKAKKLEQARKKKEQERKKAEEAARKAKEKREKEEKALKEAQKRKELARKRAAEERRIQDQLAAEQAVRQERRRKVVLTETEKYKGLIYSRIKQYWLTDPSFVGKPCKLNIRMASNGFVTQVRAIEGDPAVCRSAENAVRKAGTLPISEEPDVNRELREIIFIFKLEK